MKSAERLKGHISAGTPQLSPISCHFTGTPALIRYRFSPPTSIISFRIWVRENDGVTDGHGTIHSELRTFIQFLNPNLGFSLSLPPPAQVPGRRVPGRGGRS